MFQTQLVGHAEDPVEKVSSVVFWSTTCNGEMFSTFNRRMWGETFGINRGRPKKGPQRRKLVKGGFKLSLLFVIREYLWWEFFHKQNYIGGGFKSCTEIQRVYDEFKTDRVIVVRSFGEELQRELLSLEELRSKCYLCFNKGKHTPRTLQFEKLVTELAMAENSIEFAKTYQDLRAFSFKHREDSWHRRFEVANSKPKQVGQDRLWRLYEAATEEGKITNLNYRNDYPIASGAPDNVQLGAFHLPFLEYFCVASRLTQEDRKSTRHESVDMQIWRFVVSQHAYGSAAISNAVEKYLKDPQSRSCHSHALLFTGYCCKLGHVATCDRQWGSDDIEDPWGTTTGA